MITALFELTSRKEGEGGRLYFMPLSQLHSGLYSPYGLQNLLIHSDRLKDGYWRRRNETRVPDRPGNSFSDPKPEHFEIRTED
jgi:hypothetical protein